MTRYLPKLPYFSVDNKSRRPNSWRATGWTGLIPRTLDGPMMTHILYWHWGAEVNKYKCNVSYVYEELGKGITDIYIYSASFDCSCVNKVLPMLFPEPGVLLPQSVHRRHRLHFQPFLGTLAICGLQTDGGLLVKS